MAKIQEGPEVLAGRLEKPLVQSLTQDMGTAPSSSVHKGVKLETARRCSGCMIAKGRENPSWVESERPMSRKGDVESKGRWREESRPAREAWFYVVRSAHGPNKSSEALSEHPFPALDASISRCSSTLFEIPRSILKL